MFASESTNAFDVMSNIRARLIIVMTGMEYSKAPLNQVSSISFNM